jgi:hypothetical protein
MCSALHAVWLALPPRVIERNCIGSLSFMLDCEREKISTGGIYARSLRVCVQRTMHRPRPIIPCTDSFTLII